jgi:exo-poly-alpha-galacturonosidase
MARSFILIIALLISSGCTAFQKHDQNSTSSDSTALKTEVVKATPIASPQKLMVPPMAYDDSSITVIWSKPSDYSNVAGYNIYKDGALAANTKNLFYNITGLNAGSSYSFTVKAVTDSGKESAASNTVTQSTTPAMKVFNVTDYGAVGDGTTLNTKTIQKAIDECTVGGKVLIPSGTFLSGAVFLKSNMTLQIDGTLQGSDNVADYPLVSARFPYYLSGNNYTGLINAYTTTYGSITNVRICGSGTVNGSSDVVGSITGHANTILGNNQVAASGGNDSARGDMIVIKGVTNFYIGGLTLTNPAMHTIFISYSKNITANGINVSTFDIHNADGINICTSDTAYVFNSTFDAGDDCINLNAGVGEPGVKENFPDNNLRIFNCTTKRGHGGVVFGSFTGAWIQNVFVEDCVFDGTDIGLRFKTGKEQGGGARNVLCRDITIKNIVKNAAIFFDSTYSCNYPSGGPGQFKDITVQNITCGNLSKYGIYINGLPDKPHNNISISNVSIDGAKSGGAFLKYCTNSTFDTIKITNSTPAWTIDSNSTSGLIFKNCTPSPGNQPKTVQAANTSTTPPIAVAAPSIAAATPNHKVRIVLVGDSTVTDKQGWGPGFKSFLTDRAECINAARGGRSSKSFINEGHWTKALALKGDYYLIQFGHNDEPGKGDRSTDPNTTYREFMTRYIDDARAIGAKPVLVTSLVRRQWDKSDSGKINSSLAPYVETVYKLTKEKNVPVVDLYARSKELCQQLGKEKCWEFSPIKDSNQIDNTHLNAKGSVIFARLVVEELVKAVPELKPCFRSQPAQDANATAKASADFAR